MISIWLINILIFLFTSFLLKCVWSKREFYYLSWKLPGPFALPLIGNALLFLCKNEDIFERAVDIISKYPSPMRLWMGPKFTILFSDVYQAEKIMSSMKFAIKDDCYKWIKIFDGEGLITASGPKWKKDRKLMAPLFLKKNINRYFSIMLEHSNTIVEILGKKVNKSTFNVTKYLHPCICDIVNESVNGMKTNAQNGNLDKFLHVIVNMYILVHARIMKVWLQVEWIYRKTHYYQEQIEAIDVIHGFMRNAIREASKKHLNNKGPTDDPPSFLDQMLDIQKKVPDYATEDELVHHLTTLYSASEDTTLTICSFCLVVFGMYPNIQNKIFEELFSIIGKNSKTIDLSQISQLTYLEMCIKDVLRLFPIAPFIMRTTTENCEIGNLRVPKNCSVVVCIHNIHRDPKLWEKPNEFYPEHFLPNAEKLRHPFAFMPFSAGPRACLGKAYAYLAMKTILATILLNYVVEADGKLDDIRLKTDISVRPKNNCYPIRIKKRL